MREDASAPDGESQGRGAANATRSSRYQCGFLMWCGHGFRFAESGIEYRKEIGRMLCFLARRQKCNRCARKKV
jgi:hypothetical protein